MLLNNQGQALKVKSAENLTCSSAHTIEQSVHTFNGHLHKNRLIREESYEESINSLDNAVDENTKINQLSLSNQQFPFRNA